MRIAQIVCVYPPYKSGISTSAFVTAGILSSAGHEVETFTIDYDNAGQDCGAVRLKALVRLGNGGFLPQLFWRLKNFDIAYLHYPFFGAVEIVWFLKMFVWKKTKLVIHFHMEPELSSPLLKMLALPSRLIAASLFGQADSIICASLDYAEANMPAMIFKANKNKIKEIPFSVDTERFMPAEKAKSDKEVFKFIFVGGLDRAHYFKGIDVLLKALNLLDKDAKNWRLEIVGSGEMRSQYEDRARELGIADKVVFAGNVTDEDLPKKYQEADCLVLPSINKGEAFGIVLLDAMASGIPVIASDLPGVRKVFTEASGLKVKPGDAEDLAEKLKYLIDSPEVCRRMGEAARKEAEEKYSSKIIKELFLKNIIS